MDIDQITNEEAYRISQAEFKGMVIQALKDIRSDISEIKKDREVKGWINYGVSAFISGVIAYFMGGAKR